MKSPYEPPAASFSSAPESAQEGGANGLLVIGLVCALVAAILPMVIVPAFSQIFASFGADLPVLTIAVLRYHLAVWLLPLVVLAARLFWPRTQRRATVAFQIGMLLVLFASGIALYLPIFRLGAVV